MPKVCLLTMRRECILRKPSMMISMLPKLQPSLTHNLIVTLTLPSLKPTSRVRSLHSLNVAFFSHYSTGYLRSYLILPSTIYGRPVNPLVETGFQKDTSVQIPALIRASLDRRQGGVVGKGRAFWPSVHIDEGLYLRYDSFYQYPR